jgi:hypothetical protein
MSAPSGASDNTFRSDDAGRFAGLTFSSTIKWNERERAFIIRAAGKNLH